MSWTLVINNPLQFMFPSVPGGPTSIQRVHASSGSLLLSPIFTVASKGRGVPDTLCSRRSLSSPTAGADLLVLTRNGQAQGCLRAAEGSDPGPDGTPEKRQCHRHPALATWPQPEQGWLGLLLARRTGWVAFPTGPDHLGPASKKLTISTDGVMAEAKDLGEAAVEGLEALDLKQVILNVITDPTIVGTAAAVAWCAGGLEATIKPVADSTGLKKLSVALAGGSATSIDIGSVTTTFPHPASEPPQPKQAGVMPTEMLASAPAGLLGSYCSTFPSPCSTRALRSCST